jgi:hypothetical protein
MNYCDIAGGVYGLEKLVALQVIAMEGLQSDNLRWTVLDTVALMIPAEGK